MESEGQSLLFTFSSHCTAPLPLLDARDFPTDSLTSRASHTLEGKRKQEKEKESKKSFSKPLNTYFCRNQRLQLCLSQTTQAKRDPRREKATGELPLKEERKPERFTQASGMRGALP